MAKALATASMKGVITDPVSIVDYIVSIYFFSRKSCSALHTPYVTSLPWTIREYAHQLDKMCSVIQSELTTIIEEYVDELDIKVSHTIYDTVTNKSTLIIAGTFTDNGITYQMDDIMRQHSSFLESILDRG